ncbi:MAG: TonB-dependent receptor plug domain-containing protein [Pseudomonadota bacterium]
MKRSKGMACALIALGLANVAFARQTDTNKGLEEVVVVASRLPTEIYKTGHSVSVLDESSIADLGYQYGADLLRTLPGVAVNRAGGFGGLAQVRLRGADGNHLLVLVDGVNVTAAGTGEYDFASLLAADVERIEVLRGPQSGLFGSNALAGVLNIRTQAAAASPRLAFAVEGGQYNTRQVMLSATGGNSYVRGRISLVRRTTAFDLSTDDSKGNDADRDRNLTLSGRLDVAASDALSFELVGRMTRRASDTDGFDFSGGAAQGLAVDDDSFSNLDDVTLAARGRLRLAGGQLQTRFGIESTRTDLDGGSFGSDARRDKVNLDASWQWAGVVTQRSTVFLQREAEGYQTRYPFDPSQVSEQTRVLLGFGLEHRLEAAEQLFLGATVRRDHNDRFESATTWSLDASWIPGEGATRVHASLGAGVTNPTFFEQFGFVPGTFVGNPDLRPEVSLGWDLGVTQQLAGERLVLDLTWFAANLDSEIQSVFPTVVNASGESERSGVELSLTGQLRPETTFSLSYTYTDAREPEGQELRRPRHSGSLSLARSFWNGRTRLSGHLVYHGAQLDSDFRNYFSNGFVAERTRLGGYTLATVKASLEVGRGVLLFARIENLFNTRYEEVISYASPGRAAYAGIRVTLGR